MYLLDTCVLLWLAADQDSLSETVVEILRSHPSNLFISAISAFEIGVKSAKGKLELPLPVMRWFREAISHHGVEEIPVTSSIALSSTLLPPIHNDPGDRMIIATALQLKMTILTPDYNIRKYSGLDIVW